MIHLNVEICTHPYGMTTTRETDLARKQANRRNPAPSVISISKETQWRLSKGSNTFRVATDFDQTDGQCLDGKIHLSVVYAKNLKVKYCNALLSPSSAQRERDIQGRNQFPPHAHVTLASENFHRGGQAIPTSLVINSCSQIMHLLVP